MAPDPVTERRAGPAIVVGYDGSNASQAALLFAARQAGPDGRVMIVHAFELPPDMLGWPNYDRLVAERRRRGEQLLASLPLTGDDLIGPEYETELIGGPPAEMIAKVARARHADEIVVGARGQGRLRALLGSVSVELLHIADRPVVVIPTAATQLTG
jgi:nucleotide-binding universal stress UspA family protein